ncbi:MAG TPA: hypothetical protein VNY07_01815, partial [Chthoniobacterales bacterium]|nr:hypothetical protein [Chthoniobacterales bacterium]
AARERGRHGKGTEAGKKVQHRIIAFRSPDRLPAYTRTANMFEVCLLLGAGHETLGRLISSNNKL